MKEIVPEEEGIIKYSETLPKAPLIQRIFYPALILLVGFLGFGLGRLSTIDAARTPVTIEYPEAENAPMAAIAAPNGAESKPGSTASSSPIVASRNGTKYYFTWCSGASRISAKNRVYFNTASAAEARGLSKASNCPGL